MPFASNVNVLAFPERVRIVRRNFKWLRVKDCTNHVNTLIFKVKLLCFSQNCSNNGINIVISIISRAVMVNETLNFFCPLRLNYLICLGIFFRDNWWPVRSFKQPFLLNSSGKAEFLPGVQVVSGLVDWVEITWCRRNRWDNLHFRAHRYHNGLWSKKTFIGCGVSIMKRSSVCRADINPKSSRCEVDIFRSSSVNS